ncbi:glucosyltransferase domain-containing protein, partial [Cronobacter sakazakii]|nr:glucosyltransferase domain-containing protein [Cronobacter sakazakii]
MNNRINVTSTALALLFFLPFILLGPKYFDDLSRLNLGYFYWSVDGRPLAELIFKGISFGGQLTDLYPYTYILSIILLSYSTVKSAPSELGVKGVIIFSLSFISWNFIPNAAYRFDNVTMSLSLVMSILAAVKSFKRHDAIIKIIMIISCLSLYQPSLGAYLSIGICYIFVKAAKEKHISLSSFLKVGCIAIISIAAYKILIVNFFVAGDYAGSNGKIAGSTNEIINNLYLYYNFLNASIPQFMFYMYAGTLLACFALCFILAFSHEIDKKNKLTNIAILVCPLIVTLSTPSFFLILHKAPDYARAYTSFGASYV